MKREIHIKKTLGVFGLKTSPTTIKEEEQEDIVI